MHPIAPHGGQCSIYYSGIEIIADYEISGYYVEVTHQSIKDNDMTSDERDDLFFEIPFQKVIDACWDHSQDAAVAYGPGGRDDLDNCGAVASNHSGPSDGRSKGGLIMALEEFGCGQGYLKAGFLGFPKSGKTWTASLLAIETYRHFGLKGPIAFFDTETGGEYVVPMIRRELDCKVIGAKSRSLGDLLVMSRECEAGAPEILIVDSITHVWREVMLAYLDQVNKARETKGLSTRQRLEFQDWAAIKAKWGLWTDFYLNSKLHIIICGRAGFEWDFQEVEGADGQMHRELVKTGIKMKVEGEFGFEPSLLVEMERVQVPDENRKDKFRFIHRARVLGDRFNVMDGAVCDNPTGEWFRPYLAMLTPAASNVVDVTLKTNMGVNESGDAAFHQERRQRTILLEQIEGEIVHFLPGQSKEEKRSKMQILDDCFGTKSWTAIQGMNAMDLTNGLREVRNWIVAQTATTEDVEE